MTTEIALDALRKIRDTLRAENGKAITDTIWMPEGHQTLFDFVDEQIANLNVAAVEARQPDAFAVRMSARDGGYWVGIWKKEDTAQHALGKQSAGAELVPVKILGR